MTPVPAPARLFLVMRMRLRALLLRRRLDAELDEELQDHLLRQIDANTRAGMTAAEAKRAALIAMGGLARRKEEAQDARGVAVIEALVRDLGYAWRALRSRPGFTAAVVLTLGLGIGVNLAMFDVLDRLMFRPPPLMQTPERVHRVYLGWTSRGHDRVERTMTYKRFAELTQWSSAFDRTAAAAYRTTVVRLGDEVTELPVAVVSAGFFTFFDARPSAGRFFSAEEDQVAAGTAVAVLGHGFWRTRFGGDTGVLGRQLQMGDATYTIVGVAPRGLVGMTDGPAPAAFVPVTAFGHRQSPDYYQNHGWTWLEMFVRRRPGVTREAATADLSFALQRSVQSERGAATSPSTDDAPSRAMIGDVHLSRGPRASPESKIVILTTGVAVIVMLITCANVANLLLVRTVSRRRELALRLALGATRRRLFQQLLTEHLVLATLGALVGLAAAHWGGNLLRALLLVATDANAAGTDVRMLLAGGVIAICVAFIISMSPAAHLVRGDLAHPMRTGTREGALGRPRTQGALLLVQATLSTILLVGALLFVRSFQNVRSVPLGYDADSLVYVQVQPGGGALSRAEVNALSERLVTAAMTIPGVRNASPVVSVPFAREVGRGAPFVPGRDSLPAADLFTVQAGSPAYFATMGTRILRGRGISPDDRAGTGRVLVIGESMAGALWPGQDALGKQLRIGGDGEPFSTVVGVAEDVRGRDLRGAPEFWYYMPIAQYDAFYGSSEPRLMVRVDGRAGPHVESIRRRLQGEVPGSGYVRALLLGDAVASRQRPWEIGAKLFVAFGALAVVVAAVGLYGVVSYGVVQRSKELGVRMALGASSRAIVRLVVARGMGFAACGAAVGCVVAFIAGRWIEPMLFLQPAGDVAVFLAVGALLLCVAIVAILRPALRAARVDPAVSLRAE